MNIIGNPSNITSVLPMPDIFLLESDTVVRRKPMNEMKQNVKK